MVVYSAGAGVVLNEIYSNRKDSCSTITMHVDVMFYFAWIIWYVEYISVFHNKMRREGNLIHMAAIMWRFPRRKKTHKNGYMLSLSTSLFMEITDRPGNEQSWALIY